MSVRTTSGAWVSTASRSESRSPHEATRVDVGLGREQLLEALANDEAVFGEGNPDGHAQNHRWSSRPESGGAHLPEHGGERPCPGMPARLDASSGPWNLRPPLSCPRPIASGVATRRGAVLPRVRAGWSRGRGLSAGCRRHVTPSSCCSWPQPAMARRHCSRNGPRATGADSRGSTWAPATATPTGCSPRSRGLCTTASAPTVLVVDNAHLVSTPETFDALDDLARSMPSGSQLALASRSEPELPVGSLRADRRIFELRAGDMAMTRSEAGALLAAAGIRVASDGLDTLMRQDRGLARGPVPGRAVPASPAERGRCALSLRRRRPGGG